METSDRRFTSGEVCRLANLPAHVLDEWCRKGIVTPAAGGEGQGDHRQFALMQTLGILVAVKQYRSERGCVLTYVSKVVQAFADLPEADLHAAFKKGETHLATLHLGRPLLRPPMYDWINVKEAHEEVQKAAGPDKSGAENTRLKKKKLKKRRVV